MTDLLEWLARYSPAVVALIALGAAALFVLKLAVERGIAAGFQAQAKARELAISRRSAFEERILAERYGMVTDFAERLERLATQLHRERQGQPAGEVLRQGQDLVPLTDIHVELSVHRLVLGEALFTAFDGQAKLLLEIARASTPEEYRPLGERWIAAREAVRREAEEQFGISEIRFR